MTEEAPQLKKDVVPSEYREKYKATGGTCGDFIGTDLQRVGKDGVAALHSVMKENDIPEKKWAGMNPGMERMNLANVLRSRLLNGETIYILGKQFSVLHMRDDYNGKLDKDDPKTVARFAEAHSLKTDERTVKALTKTFWPPEKKAAVSAEERATIKAQKAKDKADAAQQRKDAAAKKKTDAATAKAAAAQKRKDDAAAKKAAKPKPAAKKAEKAKEPEPA